MVGIITNSDDRVPLVLESLGLRIGPRRVGSLTNRSADALDEDDISFVVLSYDVGFEKPDRKIFQAAEEMLRETLAGGCEDTYGNGIDGYEKLYVGDELKKDYVGARAAGWNSLLIDRGRKLKDPLVKVEASEYRAGPDFEGQVDV